MAHLAAVHVLKWIRSPVSATIELVARIPRRGTTTELTQEANRIKTGFLPRSPTWPLWGVRARLTRTTISIYPQVSAPSAQGGIPEGVG